MRFYIPVFSLMLVFSYIGHYSSFGFVFFIFVYFANIYVYYPFIISNSISIFLTWYTTICFLDRSLIQRMIEKNEWSLCKYIFGDIILHIVPAGVSLHLLYDTKTYDKLILYKNEDIVRLSGFYSCMTNMFWSLISQTTLQANKAYVFQHPMTWMYIWLLSIFYHMVPMIILNLKLERQKIDIRKP